ncbi:glutamate synthase-related protein, partial [Alphaproteobacteria bacterium]|nr:glutamate synthase-related protein [Alphaproteobacteria bacterium]
MSFDLVNSVFALLIVAIMAGAMVLFVLDVLQNEDAIRRNYPVIGRFRGLFTTLGEFFRQYFFAMDREELPFNRAERHWVDHASEGGKSTVAFGSTKQMNAVGNAIFVNASFPPLDHEFQNTHPAIIGPDAAQPFHPSSLFNISGMSYGAISAPAIEALSRGAAKAGCWLNTGEGALAPMHEAADADLVFQIGTAKYGVQAD